MGDCDRFVGFLRDICEGRAAMPLAKINAYRAKWGLAPLDEATEPRLPARWGAVAVTGARVAQQTNGRMRKVRRPATAKRKKSGKCNPCGGHRAAVPKPNGYGPGSQLLKLWADMPHCDACQRLAVAMDSWGKAGCLRRLDAIIADILPRARVWMAENQPWIHRAIGIVKLGAVEDLILRQGIRRKVQEAISKAPDNSPKRKPRRAARSAKAKAKAKQPATKHRPDDASNLIRSTAIGEPVYRRGTHLTVQRLPFTKEPTRHLIYHIYPAKCGDVWRRNLDWLLEYIDLFNGRRIVAIAVDKDSHSAEAVEDHLAGEVLEFMVYHNSRHVGEMVSFLPLLAQVETDDPNVVTFRAHAKGVSRVCKDRGKPHILTWTEMLYRANLTDWSLVKSHLEAVAMTGACRMLHQFDKHAKHPTYSGSFYWFRNCYVFSRDWCRVDNPRWGCESWPGKLFSVEETRCLLNDDTGSMYSEKYWKGTVEPAYRKWMQERGM
jgi:hypothetical protein